MSSLDSDVGAGDDGQLVAGDLVAGKYQVERLLGRGGMAEVYAATNVETQKRVALKRILPTLAGSTEGRLRLRREAHAAGRIHHPNVITVFDVVDHQGSLCLVMELLEGETLASRLARVGPLSLVEAVVLILPAMRGVAAAHLRGVIHRDLKPENIFVCLDPSGLVRDCKVLDFGVSKLTVPDPGKDITLVGNLVGTPAYMAPEQVRGSREVDGRVDVYSLGVVLYQMLAGRPPFVGETLASLMIDIATEDVPPLVSFRKDVPKRLAAVVHRALERDPDARYATVPELTRALEEAARAELHLPFGTPPEGLITQISLPRPTVESSSRLARSSAPSPRLRQIALGSGVVIVLVFTLLMWQRARGPGHAKSASGGATTGAPAGAEAAGSTSSRQVAPRPAQDEDKGAAASARSLPAAGGPVAPPAAAAAPSAAAAAAPSAAEAIGAPATRPPSSTEAEAHQLPSTRGTPSRTPAKSARTGARPTPSRREPGESHGGTATGDGTGPEKNAAPAPAKRHRAGRLSVDDF